MLAVFLLQAGAPNASADEAGSKWAYWTAEATQLRGANVFQKVQDWEGSDPSLWYPSLTDCDYEKLGKAGANWVNLSVPGPYDVDSGLRNPVHDRRLYNHIQAAGRAGLLVVLSFRSAPGRSDLDVSAPESEKVVRTLFQDGSKQDAFTAMWADVASQYRDSPHVIGYNLLVEPHAAFGADAAACQAFRRAWRELAQRTIEAIRAVDGDTPILISPDNWSTPSALAAWDLLRGDHLVCAISQYAPYAYTHENMGYERHFPELKQAFAVIDAWRGANGGAPIAIVEHGLLHTRPRAHHFIEDHLKLIEARGINHAIWIWEVADKTYTSRDFDLRKNRRLFKAVKKNWKLNPPRN